MVFPILYCCLMGLNNFLKFFNFQLLNIRNVFFIFILLMILYYCGKLASILQVPGADCTHITMAFYYPILIESQAYDTIWCNATMLVILPAMLCSQYEVEHQAAQWYRAAQRSAKLISINQEIPKRNYEQWITIID